MQYKIVRYREESIFLSSKKELFNFIDIYTQDTYCKNRYVFNARRYFTDAFIIGLTGNFIVECKEVTVKNIYTDILSDVEEKKYVNGIFIIYDENNKKVDLDKLFGEYSQSRDLNKDRRNTRKGYDRSTSSWRKYTKNYCKVYSKNNSFKKEYRDNITAKEYGVKVRSSRAKEVQSYHIWMYEDSMDYHYPERNWKSQSKKRKQWKPKK
jgi:hypothetical protein